MQASRVLLMKKGVHPTTNIVRLVLANGAVVYTQMAWQRADPSAIPTRFLEVDMTNHEVFTGVKSKVGSKTSRREQFEKKFAVGKDVEERE